MITATAGAKTAIVKIDAEEFRMDSLPVFSPEECERAHATVLALRDHWVQRHETVPFFSLGAASYLDASHGRFAEYQAKVRQLNPILAGAFSWLYQRFAAVLSDYTGEPCLYDDEIAYPGFHVFLEHEEADSSGSMHYDLQADNIDWSAYRRVDHSHQISFTLAVRLPASGSGLYVWNLNDELLRRMSPEERKRHIDLNRQPMYHPYVVGEVVVHSGHYLHQIARIRRMAPGDERITLQGHAAWTEKGWVLYW